MGFYRTKEENKHLNSFIGMRPSNFNDASFYNLQVTQLKWSRPFMFHFRVLSLYFTDAYVGCLAASH